MDTLKTILFITCIAAIILGVIFGVSRLVKWSNADTERIHQVKKEAMIDCMKYWTSEGIEWDIRFEWCYKMFVRSY